MVELCVGGLTVESKDKEDRVRRWTIRFSQVSKCDSLVCASLLDLGVDLVDRKSDW